MKDNYNNLLDMSTQLSIVVPLRILQPSSMVNLSQTLCHTIKLQKAYNYNQVPPPT